MKYKAIVPYESDDILYIIFEAQAPHLDKVRHMFSSIHYHEAGFFVEIFKRIMDGDDQSLKLVALRAIEEAMQSKSTSIGAEVFSTAINRFMANHPEYSDEMEEILSGVYYFQTLYSERNKTDS